MMMLLENCGEPELGLPKTVRVDSVMSDPQSDAPAPPLGSQLQTLVHLREWLMLNPGYPLAHVVLGKESGMAF